MLLKKCLFLCCLMLSCFTFGFELQVLFEGEGLKMTRLTSDVVDSRNLESFVVRVDPIENKVEEDHVGDDNNESQECNSVGSEMNTSATSESSDFHMVDRQDSNPDFICRFHLLVQRLLSKKAYILVTYSVGKKIIIRIVDPTLNEAGWREIAVLLDENITDGELVQLRVNWLPHTNQNLFFETNRASSLRLFLNSEVIGALSEMVEGRSALSYQGYASQMHNIARPQTLQYYDYAEVPVSLGVSGHFSQLCPDLIYRLLVDPEIGTFRRDGPRIRISENVENTPDDVDGDIGVCVEAHFE